MRVTLSILVLVTTMAWLPALAEDSPISSLQVSTNNSPKCIAAAKERGAATAAKDIKAGKLRILHFGQPWSANKPLVDEATGYRVQIIADCIVGKEFAAEVEAYNRSMREWHAKAKSSEPNRKE